MDKNLKTHSLVKKTKDEPEDNSLINELGDNVKDLFGDLESKYNEKHKCFHIDIAIIAVIAVLIIWAIKRRK